MSAHLAQLIGKLAPEGLQINIWPCEKGFQANVKERAANGWTCASNTDPIAALEQALTSRAARIPDRQVVSGVTTQVDLEEYLAEVPAGAAARDAVTDAMAELGL